MAGRSPIGEASCEKGHVFTIGFDLLPLRCAFTVVNQAAARLAPYGGCATRRDFTGDEFMASRSRPSWKRVFDRAEKKARERKVISVYCGSCLMLLFLILTHLVCYSELHYAYAEIDYGLICTAFLWVVGFCASKALALYTHRNRAQIPRHVQYIGCCPSVLILISIPIFYIYGMI